jgi:hypothetical protein
MTTHIVIVMDRSGSMRPLAEEAAGATNTFVESLKDIKGRKSVTIHQFDDHFETTCSEVGQTKVPELIAGKNYVPRGMTSLYDAIGKSINDLGNKKNVVMCVVTDGGENSSREFNYDNVKKMISEKTEKGWKFDFLSSDLTAVQHSMDLGFNNKKFNPDAKTEDFYFAASASGYANSSSVRTASVASYMSNLDDENKSK